MSGDVTKYVNNNGDLEFPKYLYKSLNDLMKHNLDLGTLVTENPQKLRAYKEMVKSSFKQKWLEIAAQLCDFGLIEPCVCKEKEFCSICGGSRYLLDNAMFDADVIRHQPINNDDKEMRNRLEVGLEKALEEIGK